MDNKQVTDEWIAQQRQISEIVNMTYEDAPGSVVPLLKQLEKSQTAALDALEAAMAESAQWKRDYGSAIELLAEKIQQISRLTAERDAEKRRADAAVDDIAKVCQTCKHRFDLVPTGEPYPQQCNGCNGDKWEWRGPVAANTDAPKEDAQEGSGENG